MHWFLSFAESLPHKEGRHGSLLLPDTCLANVMACLADTLEHILT
jgi:hypothetical protein